MNNMTSAASFSARTSVFLILGMLLALILTFATAPAYTEANLAKYAYGNLALEIWGVEGREKSPPWVFYWVHFIALLGVTSLFFMRNHVEARWAGGGIFFATIFFSVVLIPILPVVQLGGMFAVMHFILWTPGLYLLLKNRPFLNGWSPYAIWSGLATFTILFSYVFDVRDVLVYVPHIWSLYF